MLLLVAFLCAAVSSVVASSGQVIELTDETFESVVGKEKYAVKFYAPWCGHCKSLAPVWEATAFKLKDVVPFARVDCTANADVCGRYDVKGYPTLKFFDGPVVTTFNSQRTEEGLTSFVKRMLQPTVRDVADAGGADAFRKQEPVSFVLHAPGSGEAEKESVLDKTCAALKHIAVCAVARTDDVAAAVGAGAPGSLHVLRPDDEPQAYAGPWLVANLTEWITANQFPRVMDVGVHNFHHLVQNGRLAVIGTVDPYGNKAALADFRQTMLDAALAFRDELHFGILDGVRWSDFTKKFNITTDDLPTYFVLDGATQHFFREPAMANELPQMTAFLRRVLDGEVQQQGGGWLTWFTDSLESAWYVTRDSPVLLGVILLATVMLLAQIYFLCASFVGSDDDKVLADMAKSKKKKQ